LWVRLTAASYQPSEVKTMPKATADGMEKYYKGEDFKCRPSEGGVTCEKKADGNTTKVTFAVSEDKIAGVRLQVTPDEKLKDAAPAAKQAAIALLGQFLADKRLATAEKWLKSSFD